jgi:hypothetical protein
MREVHPAPGEGFAATVQKVITYVSRVLAYGL